MSKVTSFGAATGETVLDSSADMSAAERSCAVAGVVTCDEMLLSRHHFTTRKNQEDEKKAFSLARLRRSEKPGRIQFSLCIDLR